MLTLDQIRDHLTALKGGTAWREISEASGVEYNHLTRIVRGEVVPSATTAERISDAIEARREAA